MPKQTNPEKTENAGEKKTEHERGERRSILPALLIVLLAGTVIVNQYMINSIASAANNPLSNAASPTGLAASSTAAQASGRSSAQNSIIPAGVPAVYGKEIGISFDDVSASNPRLADQTIGKLSAYDRSITLSGDKLKRYINVASNISCEYCCGAQSIIFPDGSAACGCAHSYAMRGLAKYLLEKHADEYTDDKILEEMGKWKTLFFPGKLIAKAAVLKEKGIEFNYINLASNKYRGIEQGAKSAGGGMVGGC